jgi:adenylate kinase
MNLIFIGKQGVGKGTYAQRISEEYNVPQLSTGDLLRAEVKSGSELGKKFDEQMKAGILVDDSDVSKLLEKRMLQSDAKKGFILDGYPRTENQAKVLDDLLKKLGSQITTVLNFVAPDAVLLQRLTGRRQCSKCGKIYHLINIKPKKDGVCDIDNAPLFQREDDKEEAIRKRWEAFEQQTKPVLAYYKKKGKLVEVDASKEVAEIMPRVEKILEEIKNK